MKLLKSKSIKIGLLVAVTAAVPIVTTSCNVDQTREQKDMHLDKSDFDSKEYSTIKEMIQTTVQESMFNQYYADQVVYNSWTTKNAATGNWEYNGKQKRYSNVKNVVTEKDARRFFLDEKGGIGNFGSDYVGWAINQIRENSAVTKDLQLLLNKMSTIYNRTIVIYPTKVVVKQGEFVKGNKATEGKYLHAEFRADLQTPMKRRFMKKFMTLNIDIPIDDSSLTDDPAIEMKRLKAILNVKDAKSITTTTQLRRVLSEASIFGGQATVDKANHSVVADASFSKMYNPAKSADLMGGMYPLNAAKSDPYVPEFTGQVDLKTGKINDKKTSIDKEYNFGYWDQKANVEAKKFKGSQKVSELTEFIKNKMFVNSEQPIIKELFGKNGNWDVKVVARTWAGNEGSNYFLSDWIENLGHRTNYFYYFTNKKDASQTFYMKAGTSLAHPKEGN
ncbi:hypothetical protein [Mycoplasma todarodis]|uniref:Lipoprotein n=1 Tax=Mycoplasma todarodis TaxID=1937191 RepID=A0A4R0XQF7_9MOLU|nr:hypothetical protein [Mycoplasma todarodis]TCG11816.1 hypothetical protein C4B25_00665 [Mycoplasma todarodis]